MEKTTEVEPEIAQSSSKEKIEREKGFIHIMNKQMGKFSMDHVC